MFNAYLRLLQEESGMNLGQMRNHIEQEHEKALAALTPKILRQSSLRQVVFHGLDGEVETGERCLVVYVVLGRICFGAVKHPDDLWKSRGQTEFGEVKSYFDMIRHWKLMSKINTMSQEMFDLIGEAISVGGDPEDQQKLINMVGRKAFDEAMIIDKETVDQYLELLVDGLVWGTQLSREVHRGMLKWQDRFEEYRQYAVLDPDEWLERLAFTCGDDAIELMSTLADTLSGKDEEEMQLFFTSLSQAVERGFGYVFDCGFASREDVSVAMAHYCGLLWTLIRSDIVYELLEFSDTESLDIVVMDTIYDYYGEESLGSKEQCRQLCETLWKNHESLLGNHDE